jgi:hypothetical protein
MRLDLTEVRQINGRLSTDAMDMKHSKTPPQKEPQ